MLYDKLVATVQGFHHRMESGRGRWHGHKALVVWRSFPGDCAQRLGIVATRGPTELGKGSRSGHPEWWFRYTIIGLLEVIQRLHLCSISRSSAWIRIGSSGQLAEALHAIVIPIINFGSFPNSSALRLREGNVR